MVVDSQDWFASCSSSTGPRIDGLEKFTWYLVLYYYLWRHPACFPPQTNLEQMSPIFEFRCAFASSFFFNLGGGHLRSELWYCDVLLALFITTVASVMFPTCGILFERLRRTNFLNEMLLARRPPRFTCGQWCYTMWVPRCFQVACLVIFNPPTMTTSPNMKPKFEDQLWLPKDV